MVGDLSETLPDEPLRQRLKLPGLARSLRFLHTPPPGTDLDYRCTPAITPPGGG